MKPVLVAALFLAAGACAGAADSFFQQLTPEERKAAGLAQLTPEQEAALDRLAERYAQEGARATAAAVREEARQEARTAARAQVEQEVQKREESKFGLFGAKGQAEAIRSRIQGPFRGWNGRTLFVLENGQQWVQADTSDVYWLDPRPGPEVEIRQSGLGGWKLFVQPNGRWVRVRRVN